VYDIRKFFPKKRVKIENEGFFSIPGCQLAIITQWAKTVFSL